MNFDLFLKKAWEDHAKDARAVALRLPAGIASIETGAQIVPMTALIVHVLGEHLGEWQSGCKVLADLTSHPKFERGSESDAAVQRGIASLKTAAGDKSALDSFSASDRVRILAVASAALCSREVNRARELFLEAMSVSQTLNGKEDPAHRALAVTANNLACEMEEMPEHESHQTEFMLLAAEAARKYWEIAGTWLQVERAEYRLAKSNLKAGKSKQAGIHAQNCIEISRANSADALELFFGYEALACAEKACENSVGFRSALSQAEEQFAALSDADKAWCEESLRKLKAL